MELMNVDNKYLQRVLPEITETHLKTTVLKLGFIGGGSFGKVFKAELSDGNAVAIKAFREKGAHREEAEQLEILAKHTSVKMPEVLFVYEDEKVAVMGMSFIEGSNTLNPAFLFKSRKQKQAFARAVIQGMLEWHSITGEKFGDLKNPVYNTWAEYYRREKQEPILKGLADLSEKGKFSRRKLEILTEATEIFNRIYKETADPVLIHGDLNIMNIMADVKTMKLTGFIDPKGTIWADREYDLFQLLNMWGNSFGLYETYKKAYPLSEYADFKVAYYGAMHEASMRLGGGLIMPLWEDLDINRLKNEMKKLQRLL